LVVSRLFVAGHIIGDNKVKSLFLKQEERKEKDRVLVATTAVTVILVTVKFFYNTVYPFY
jgi:hypothetical protein